MTLANFPNWRTKSGAPTCPTAGDPAVHRDFRRRSDRGSRAGRHHRGYYSGHAQPVSLIVCDASFIGLELVLANPLALARPGARLVALIKPQFEVGPEQVGKGGIVRDPALHTEVCDRIETWLGHQGWDVLGVTPSPIVGARGSQEFLIAARLGVT